MSQVEETYSKKVLNFSFLIIGVSIFISGFALASVQGLYDRDFPEHFHLKLSEQQHLELDKDIGDAALTMKTFVNTKFNSLNQTVIENTVETEKNKNAITDVKVDIKSKFPEGQDVANPGTSVGSTTPILTLKINKSTFIPGETIVFSGTGYPDSTVIINIQKYGGCGQNDICAAWTTVDRNGSFELRFETEFDDPVGAWKAYVKAGEDRSATIVFEVEE